MYAVIESGGKQHRVEEGEVLKLEKLDASTGDSINFDKVLMIGEGAGVKIGKPYVEGSVTAEVISHGRGDKVSIIKFRRRKHSMKRQGHRQWFTEVKITGISEGKAAPYGSGYERVTKQVKESLRDWFKKEDWVRINTSGNISGDCGTMKKGKATTRCLPRKKAQSLTKAQRKATVAKKVRGDKKGKQFVSNTKSAKYRKKSNEE